MTPEIGLVLGILGTAVVLFVTDKVRVDVVALLVLLALALSGLVTSQEALSGFSNPAVITVWAVFILSGGLTRTGIAALLGRQVLRVAGRSEMGLVTAIMLSAGGLSAFMNNVGVAALLLPVVMDIARRTGTPPSKLLIPLAFSSLLGGLTTLIGTPPNILISDALAEYGLAPFSLFDFTPAGGAVLLAGIAYMALVGRHRLPARDPERLAAGAQGDGADLSEIYRLRERLSVLHVPEGSILAGKSLAESRIGSALGVNVVGVHRRGETRLAPNPETVLRAGDRLLVEGQLDRLGELRGARPHLRFEEESPTVLKLMCDELDFHELALTPGSSLVGHTLRQLDFRGRYGVSVLALWRQGALHRARLADRLLEAGDVLLVQGPCEEMEVFDDNSDFVVSKARRELYPCAERLMMIHVPEGSSLKGKTLPQARLGEDFGLIVLGVARDGTAGLITDTKTPLEIGDVLLAEGRPEDLMTVQGLHDLRIDDHSLAELGKLEDPKVGLAEVALSPRTAMAGRTLRDMHFRERYGLSVLAILREGQVIRTGLRTIPLRFGDALLLYGPRDRIRLLHSEPGFIVLTEEAAQPLRLAKAPLALAAMAAVLVPVILGWLPIHLAAIGGATLMVLTRCLTMDEAYRFIEWRAVFLIAGMLPLGIALEKTGAAHFLTGHVVSVVGELGPLGVVAGLYLTTAIGAQIMPTAAVAILMAPIAINTAHDLGLSPHALMMTVALSASASFMSPVAHPANILIMGPGGYRFTDYIRVGLPLTVVCLVVAVLVVPLLWPLE